MIINNDNVIILLGYNNSTHSQEDSVVEGAWNKTRTECTCWDGPVTFGDPRPLLGSDLIPAKYPNCEKVLVCHKNNNHHYDYDNCHYCSCLQRVKSMMLLCWWTPTFFMSSSKMHFPPLESLCVCLATLLTLYVCTFKAPFRHGPQRWKHIMQRWVLSEWLLSGSLAMLLMILNS